MGAFVIVHGQYDLPDIIQTLCPAGGFTSRLNGGQQECHKDRDDRDHHKQFHECEALPPHAFAGHLPILR
jgi:hypothetical protein